MSVSLSSLNVSNGMIYRNMSTARAEAEAANGRPYRLEVEVTDKSILTDKDDFTAGRWRVLENGTKVFNAIGINTSDKTNPSYDQFQKGMKKALEMAPLYEEMAKTARIEKENHFTYVPMKDSFSWSNTYMGMISRADNPEATASERLKENLYQELKSKVESILDKQGNPVKSDLRFGINKGVPYYYESVKTGNGKENLQNASGEIGDLIKDFWEKFHSINKGLNINV